MGIDIYDVWECWKGKIKKYRVFLICLIEIIFLAVYVFNVVSSKEADYFFYGTGLKEESFETSWELRTEEISLDKGIYDITVQYRAANGGTAEVFGQMLNNQSIWYNPVTLASWKTEAAFQVWINDKMNGFGILVRSESDDLTVDHIRIKTAWNSRWYLIICFFVKICFLDLFLFGIMFWRKLQKYSVEILGILGIAFICSIGLFTRYLVPGHDMVFHMNRIEGLKDGLLSGAFPVRIQPTWNNGWGYAVSLMYGDLTLLFPALMRICGFTVQTTWKTFIATVNLGTAILAFYAFWKICKNKYKALFANLIYCTGLYRIACIYIRSAVGEFTVMAFLPLVVLGFWYVFGEEAPDKEYGKKLAAPVIGFTGMIQTHVLTCEMSALFMVIFCILMLKKELCKKTFIYLVKIAVVTVLVNLWFLIPFFSLMREDLVISGITEMRDDFQTWGLSITELFATTASSAWGFTFGENVSLAGKCTFTVGLALWGSVVTALFLLWNEKVEKPKAALISAVFGLSAAFLTTNLFPYEAVKRYFPNFSAVFSKIQFSYRFLGLTALFFTLSILFVLMNIQGKRLRPYLMAALTAIAVLAAYQGMDYQYRILYGGMITNIYSGSALNTTEVVSGEYLYQNTFVEITNIDNQVIGNGVEVLETQKKYLSTSVVCRAYEKGAYIEIPVFYYPGYQAVDSTGKNHKVSKSDNNNRIRVDIPDGFEGTVYIAYKEPLYWRICEIISFIALTGLLFRKKAEKYLVPLTR